MNFLKNTLGRIFAVWALFVFGSTMLWVSALMVVTQSISEPRRSVITQKIFRAWMKVFFVCTGVRRIFKGYQNFAPGQVYVIACNHRSYMDPPLSSAGIIPPNRTIAKVEMARIPLFGIVYRRGSVLVNRKSEESRKQSYMRMREVLRQGMHMCIYPEGTRNRTQQPLQKFHDGAFRLATEADHDVMPAVLFYTDKVLPTNKSFFFWPHRVEMHFLPPVSAGGKTTEALKAEVFGLMEQYYITHNSR